ncbi:MAG: hypothetical protein AB4426_26660 [Xenococcaceae cyanobacterium]
MPCPLPRVWSKPVGDNAPSRVVEWSSGPNRPVAPSPLMSLPTTYDYTRSRSPAPPPERLLLSKVQYGMKENAIFLSSAMSKGFAPVSTTTQCPTPPTAPAVDAQEIQFIMAILL